MSILLPVLILLLTSPESSPTPPPSHKISLAHLLNLAATQPGFKEATGNLTTEQKRLLEASIRASLGSAGTRKDEERKEESKKIELRSFG